MSELKKASFNEKKDPVDVQRTEESGSDQSNNLISISHAKLYLSKRKFGFFAKPLEFKILNFSDSVVRFNIESDHTQFYKVSSHSGIIKPKASFPV